MASAIAHAGKTASAFSIGPRARIPSFYSNGISLLLNFVEDLSFLMHALERQLRIVLKG